MRDIVLPDKPLPNNVTMQEIYDYIQEIKNLTDDYQHSTIWWTFAIKNLNNCKRYRLSEPDGRIYEYNTCCVGIQITDLLDFNKPLWSIVPDDSVCNRCYREITKENYRIETAFQNKYCKICYEEYMARQ